MLKIIENLFFYTKCNFCSSIDLTYLGQNIFCKACINSIKKENITYCKSCGKKTSNCLECKIVPKFKEIEIFSTYSGVLREITLSYKFEGYKNLSKVLAKIIEKDITYFIRKYNINLILPVPSSRSIEKKRGFNHLEEILKNIPSCKKILSLNLKKIKDTPLQIEVSGKDRAKNIKNAFYLKNYKYLEGKNILIFDDILTTGATLKEIYYTLSKININNIYAYVIST
ncbi:MAG TPA: ComF family protein [Hydrogenothermaceae bacterium]|nr:ComF family protein [Hydrogenothermaceae bacterium]